MKKTKIIFVILLLLFKTSVFVSAQDANKPSKEDFYHTWVTSGGSGLSKYTFKITFLNESSYVLVTKTLFNPKQEFNILNWEEALNTYTDIEEYPYGYKISSKDTKNGAINNFSIFYFRRRRQLVQFRTKYQRRLLFRHRQNR